MKANPKPWLYGPDWQGQRCEARTRRGTPCKRPARLPVGRCKLHGGASTGPRTKDGLARLTEARTKHGLYTKEKRAEARRFAEEGRQMRGSSRCKPRKAVLGLRTGGSPSMELTAAHRESSGTLAQGPATGLGLAPNTLPVWAVKPWFGISFHCAHISSVYGVLLYPILDGFARHACLGPRTTARAKLTNTNLAQATLKAGT